MAKQDDLDLEVSPKPKRSKLALVKTVAGLLGKLLSYGSVLALFGGVYNLGFVDLRPTLYPLGAYFLYAFAVGVPLSFLSGKKKEAAGGDVQSDDAGVSSEAVTGLKKKISHLESKVNSVFAGHYDVLKEENEKFKTELEALEEEKTQKVFNELEHLRARNSELQEQLKNLIALSNNASNLGASEVVQEVEEEVMSDGIMPAASIENTG
ncbi:MAG: cell division protein ZapB [Nitratireductor sp.]